MNNIITLIDRTQPTIIREMQITLIEAANAFELQLNVFAIERITHPKTKLSLLIILPTTKF